MIIIVIIIIDIISNTIAIVYITIIVNGKTHNQVDTTAEIKHNPRLDLLK